MGRRMFLSLVVVALLGCRSVPEKAGPAVSDPTTMLGLAVNEARRARDPVIRSGLYTELAWAYREAGQEADAVGLARHVLETREIPPGEESLRWRLSAAVLLSDRDGGEAFRRVAGQALAATADTDAARAVVLVDVVRAALQAGEAGRAVLRQALEEVYIVEDNAARADAIIVIASLYQAGGVGLSVTGLVNQAIPAVRSVPDRYARAAFFGRLAHLAHTAREDQLTRRMVSNALAELPQAVLPPEAERPVLQLVESLSLVDPASAAAAAEMLSDPHARVLGMLALAGRAAEPEPLHARAFAEATRIEDAQQLADALARIAAAELPAGDRDRALHSADLALQVVAENPQLLSRVALLSDLARLYARLDRAAALLEYLELVPDDYARGVVAVAASEPLAAAGQSGLAEELLLVALFASDRTDYLADDLRERTAVAFAQAGNVRLAIRAVERMIDPDLRARAVTQVALTAERAGLGTALLRADLASVLGGR